MFEKEEMMRYDRQIILPELGIDGQQKLKQASILVIGAGGLGCPVLLYLAAAGVGFIGIVDDDTVAISNLHRQILFNINDISINKADAAREKLLLLNPHVQISSYPVRLTDSNAHELIRGYDLVIDGSDNFTTRYLVNDTCVALKKPLIYGSIFKFEGQVSVFNYHDGPNYRDLFPEAPAEGEMPNCADIGVIGVLPGIVGTLMANEAIKVICKIGDVLSGRLLTIDTLGLSFSVFKFYGSTSQLQQQTTPANTQSTIYDIDLTQLEGWDVATSREWILIDVRESYEFEDFNIGGINIPLYELPDRISELPVNKTVVFCCSSGVRSKQAATLFKQLTTRGSLNLRGGLKNYGTHANL